MAYASWIPASKGAGMPRYGVGFFNVPTQQWARQVGLKPAFYAAYTGFASAANMESGAYYGTHQYDVAGTFTSSSTGIIPVLGTALATQDGLVTLDTIAAGTNDAMIQLMLNNAYAGGAYTEIWWRLGYEANIQTTQSGWTSSQTNWGARWKAAFEHWATVARVYMAASFPTRTMRILFDTCPLNNIATGVNGNSLAVYKPDSVAVNPTGGYDIMSLDFYTCNYFPQSYTPLTNYASLTPFTLNATYGTTTQTENVDNWASDYAANEAPGVQGYTYNNAAHFLTFQDAQPGSPNGGAGQSLYSLVTQAATDQVPIFHSEFGGIGYENDNPGVTTGSGWVNLSTVPVVARASLFNACNDLNYVPYVKRMWAAIEAIGPPCLGCVAWDRSNATLMSGNDALSGLAHPGMRSTFQVLMYPIGHYGAVDPILVVNDIPASLVAGALTTIQIDANYALTLANITVDAGEGAGPQALPTGAALIGTNSASFSFTPTTVGGWNMVAKDTALGYSSPPSDYVVTGTSISTGGGGTGGGTTTTTGTSAPSADYAALLGLGKPTCVAEFRPGSASAGDSTFALSTLVSALQTQMPEAVFWQQYWDTNPTGTGWGMASVQGVAAALSLPWVINRGEFAVNPVVGVRNELLTITMSDGSVITETQPAGTTITSQTLA